MKALLPLVVLAVLLLAAGLSGCSLYLPTITAMPRVQAAGEAEVMASLHSSGRLEATAAYSPVPHVVLSGTGITGLIPLGGQYISTRQGELGLGGYWLLGQSQRWLLSAMAGGGLARVKRRDAYFLGGGYGQQQGRYSKGFGQVGVAYLVDEFSVSLTYRLSRVGFTEVLDDVMPVPDFGTYRHDAALALRGRPAFLSDRWYVQSTVGLSLSNVHADSDQWSTGGRPALLGALGIGYYFRPRQP